MADDPQGIFDFDWSAMAVAGDAARRLKAELLRSARPLQPPAKRSRRRAPKTPAPSTVIVFPLARRRDFVFRHASLMAALSAEQGYVHLHKQLQVQAKALRRKGIAEGIIEIEINSLASAVRVELWRILFDVQVQRSSSS